MNTLYLEAPKEIPYLSQPSSFPERGGLPSVDGDGLLLAGLAGPREALPRSTHGASRVGRFQDVRGLLLVLAVDGTLGAHVAGVDP